MKKIIFTLILTTFFIGFSKGSKAEEANQMPFASSISTPIKHYNKIKFNVATSGIVGEGGYRELSAHGVKTFIDLRTPEEINRERIDKELESKDSTYFNIPVYGSDGISKEQVHQFADIFENSKKPVLINCGSGNRAGALWAAYLLSKGASLDVALEEGRTSGMKASLEQDVKNKFCTTC